MKLRQHVKNKKFKTVKDKLEFIQKECLEPELFEDLKHLFLARGFENVKITHGNKEYGKDLVFSRYNEDFDEVLWYAVIVKNKPAKQNDFVSGGEIANQINLAFQVPFSDTKGKQIQISRIFIVINGNVTDNAITTLSGFIDSKLLQHIKIWDYQELEAQIERYTKESFLDNLEPALNAFVKEQTRILSDISIANSVYDLNIDDINEIFINVQTTYSKELRKINEYVSFDNEKDQYYEEDIEGSNEILNSDKNFIIHGIPTSGKTIFLKRIGIKALNANGNKINAVFYFDLQNMNTESIDIVNELNNQYFNLTKEEEFIEAEFNKIILLVDSIDFVKEDTNKIDIFKKFEEFGKDKKNYQIIFATRDIEFIRNNSLLNDYKSTELLPFNFNQALKLVKKIIPNDESKTHNFIKALKNSLLDTSLQRTPLALTLMAILYRDDKVDLKELPANIFELYNKFTDVYLDRWDNSKGVTQLYKYEQTKNILAFIAFHLHKLGLNSIHEDELKSFLLELRKSYNYDELNTPEKTDDFICHLKTKNGVFYYNPVEKSFYFFNHHFQEYFSSLCIEDDDEKVLIEQFFNSWWSNALVFYCGKNNKSNKLHREIIEKIIPIGSFQKIYYINQHSKCLQASHSIAIKDRTAIVKKLLVEFNNIFIELYKEGVDDISFYVNQVPFVNMLNQSKSIFEATFNSKHISTEETIELFEQILAEDNGLTNITNYNIAYYLAFHKGSPKPFELFSTKIDEDIVWNRILYVDINFLNLKKKINEKSYLRIKRKMNKHKFLIQEILNQSLTLKSLKELYPDIKEEE